MSVKAMALVWDMKLPQGEKLVLLAYADHAAHDGSSIYPAVSTIAEKTGYSERSVQTITRTLEEKGLLIDDGKGPKGTNKWRLGVQNLRGAESAGVQNGTSGGAVVAEEGGAVAIAPEPSLTVIKPSSAEDEKTNSLAGLDPLVRGMLEMAEWPAAKMDERLNNLCDALSAGLGRNFHRSTTFDAVAKRILKDGRDIRQFIRWATRDDKAREYNFVYVRNPETIWQDWPQAFATVSKDRPHGRPGPKIQ